MSRLWLILVLCTATLLTSCGGDDTPQLVEPTALPSTSASPAASGIPAGDAKIAISSPREGDTISGNKVEIVTEVTGFDLVDKIGKKAERGEGHIVYYVGSGYQIPVDPSRPGTIGGNGVFTAYTSHKTSYTWENLAPGRQTLSVQLVNNDNKPLAPSISAQVTVTIDG
jgi:hypothetical protein